MSEKIEFSVWGTAFQVEKESNKVADFWDFLTFLHALGGSNKYLLAS